MGALYRALHAAQRAAGLAQAGFHTLRHSYAAHLTEGNMSPIALRDQLGHSDLSETERYAHLSPSYTERGIAAIDRGRTVRAG